LPVYHPSQEDLEDPAVYANNVPQLLAKASQVPTNNLTFEEVKAKYARFYKNVDKNKLEEKPDKNPTQSLSCDKLKPNANIFNQPLKVVVIPQECHKLFNDCSSKLV